LRFGIGKFNLILIGLTTTGVTFLSNKNEIGTKILLLSSIGWLLRYFEHIGFILLYDSDNFGRIVITLIPILFAIPLFIVCLKQILGNRGIKLNWHKILLVLIIFPTIGILSFLNKTHIQEFNCWYDISKTKNEFEICFALSPNHIFKTNLVDNNLKDQIIETAMTDQTRNGYYCPETKIKVQTSFKKLKSIKILGFRNTNEDQNIKFKPPIKINSSKLTGQTSILKPEFTIGD